MDAVDEAVDLLNNAKRLLFITGAGVSADSGLPTYRGIGGLYNRGDTEDGIPIEEALSGSTFQNNPALSWKYLSQIEQAARGHAHNDAHAVIAGMEKRFDVTVLTQNVDGFHSDAGSTDVIEIHGNMRRLLCTACDWTRSVEDYTAVEIPPVCPECAKSVRPDVVLFGEMLPPKEVERMQRVLEDPPEVVLSVGTTSAFPYIAGPVVLAAESGISTIEINPGETAVSRIVDVRIERGAAEAMKAIEASLG